MSSKKRERDTARRRYHDWQSRRSAKGARAHQVRQAVGVVLALGAVAVVATLVVLALRPENIETVARPAPSPEPTETVSEVEQRNPCGPSTARIRQAPQVEGTVPDPADAENRQWQVRLETSCGQMDLNLDGAAAPQAVANFITLAEAGFYDDTPCHRLTLSGIYVLQCGDQTATGTGGPGYVWGPIENAPADDVYPAGTLAMARQGDNADSQGSQFFIVYKDSTIPSDRAGGYSVFGRVESGLNVVQTVADGGTSAGSEQPARAISIQGVKVQ